MLEVYTDGSSYLGIGGWAYVAVQDNKLVMEDFGSFEAATNNRAELLAVIHALQEVDTQGKPIRIISDSAYVVNCFREQWYRRWIQNKWFTSGGSPVQNVDLWQQLIPLVCDSGREVEMCHIRGHGNNPWNNRADMLCGGARKMAARAAEVK